jgi:hypothetical protein
LKHSPQTFDKLKGGTSRLSWMQTYVNQRGNLPCIVLRETQDVSGVSYYCAAILTFPHGIYAFRVSLQSKPVHKMADIVNHRWFQTRGQQAIMTLTFDVSYHNFLICLLIHPFSIRSFSLYTRFIFATSSDSL